MLRDGAIAGCSGGWIFGGGGEEGGEAARGRAVALGSVVVMWLCGEVRDKRERDQESRSPSWQMTLCADPQEVARLSALLAQTFFSHRLMLPTLAPRRLSRCARSAAASHRLLSNASASRPPVIFSGIQPTGIPHLGNYLGALQQWVKLQNNAAPSTTLIFSIVDLHAITVRQDSRQLRQWRKEMLASLLAVGLDPKRSIIFNQSAVCARHTAAVNRLVD